MISELEEYAEYQFKLNKKRNDGSTERDHLLVAYNATGIMPEELANEIELPELTAYVWEYFQSLHAERTSNGFGPNPITSTAIKDWCFLKRIIIEPWEVAAIKRIDYFWFKSIASKESA